MLNVIEIKDFNAPELDIYARCTEARLLNKDHPEEGNNSVMVTVLYQMTRRREKI